VIAKITRGASFRAAMRYALDERHGLDRDHQPEIIGGNMAGRTSAELAREFEAVRQQRPDIRKPVEHIALSLSPSDRPLPNNEMARLADNDRRLHPRRRLGRRREGEERSFQPHSTLPPSMREAGGATHEPHETHSSLFDLALPRSTETLRSLREARTRLA